MYFGWYIVGAGMAVNAVVAGIATYGFTAMVNPIAFTFGWSFTQISLAMTLRGVESGILQPVIGTLADRYPARYLTLAGISLTSLGLLGLGLTVNLAMFYIAFLVMALGVSLSTQLVPSTIVMRWFDRDMGKAISLLTIGIGLGGLFIPLVTWAIDNLGWRAALFLLAIIIMTIGIPASYVYRPPLKPADADGRSGAQDKPKALGGILREIVCSRPFWQIGIALMCQVAALSPVMMHIMPYLVSIGFERATASTIAMGLPLASIPARFFFGWLVDRFRVKNIFALSILLTSGSLFLLNTVSVESLSATILFIVVYSLGLAGFSPLLPPAVRTYFRREIFGTALGLISIFMTIGGVSTPVIAGVIFDIYGSYEIAWPIFGFTALIGAVVMIALPSPRRLDNR
jgi:MFS family permease